jgi:Fe-S cluster biogenesis protein NfuA
MKFVANKPIVPALYEFKNIDEAKDAPLATALFQKPYVKQVFMDENYVSVTKYDIGNWDEITVELRELIRDFMASDQEAVITQKVASTKPTEGTPTKEAPTPAPSANFEEGSIEAKIVSILEEYVKPAVAADGGNIAFEKFDADSKAVHVVLQGACSGCPSSTFTLKNGIETMLQNMLGDQVGQVIAVNG